MIALFLGIESGVHAQSTAPTISTVAITSNPGSDGTYGTGDIITVNVTFSEPVTVDTTNGTPYVVLSVGGRLAYLDYSGDGSSAAVQPFNYTVQPLQRDADGVSLLSNSLALNGGTIQATDDSADADLDHPAIAFPSHKVAAGGEVVVGLAQVGIRVSADLVNADLINADRSTSNEAWQWQRSATEAGPYSDIPAADGGTSIQYTPSAGDLGKWLKATVTYDDATGTGWTAETTQQVLSQPTLSNAGRGHRNFLGLGFGDSRPETHIRYAQGFTTGPHTRGYLLTGARLALFLVYAGDTADGTWGVHADDAGKPAAEPLSAALPILNADLVDDDYNEDEEIFTLEEFTHPDGVHLEHDTKYWIVISQTTSTDDGYIGVGALSARHGTLKLEGTLNEGTPDEVLGTPAVDPGSEDGWSVHLEALAYYWNDPDDPDDDPDATFSPDHPDKPNEPKLDPALLPWELLGTP